MQQERVDGGGSAATSPFLGYSNATNLIGWVESE